MNMSAHAHKVLRTLSVLALIEGASLVALLAIAMPLLRRGSQAVSVVGMVHGSLFLLVTAALLFALSRGYLSPLKGAGVFAASLIPFGGVWSHRVLVRGAASSCAGR